MLIGKERRGAEARRPISLRAENIIEVGINSIEKEWHEKKKQNKRKHSMSPNKSFTEKMRSLDV